MLILVPDLLIMKMIVTQLKNNLMVLIKMMKFWMDRVTALMTKISVTTEESVDVIEHLEDDDNDKQSEGSGESIAGTDDGTDDSDTDVTSNNPMEENEGGSKEADDI